MRTIICCLLALTFPAIGFGQMLFNADSAYEDIRYLTVEIGPRPMGSPAEARALQWVVRKFQSYGADSAWVMPFTRVDGEDSRFNTRSGVAVGLFKGTVDTSLVVSGHIDSTPAESPGANDDASGVATAIELARVWSQWPRYYTMIFLAFGGEEMGLYGSRFFVGHFDRIDKTGLMISADMTGGEGEIATIFETRTAQAPIWLIREAFDLDDQLGFHALRYPTHFSSVNNLGEGAGSDHMPFLDAGIPAIDFTTGLNTSPIHSAQDHIGNIDRQQLDRCGRLIDALLDHYQAHHLPARRADKYLLWMPLGHPWFIPQWVQWSIVVLALAMAVFTFWRSRRRRLRVEKSQRIRFSSLKLALLFLLVILIAQCGEALIQAVKGLRYPWLLHPKAYLFLLACWAAGGLWLILQLARRWRWNRDPQVYALRALALQTIFTALFLFGSVRVALYPAMGLLLFALALLVRPVPLKAVLVLASFWPMLRLVFSEVIEFIARSITEGGAMIDSWWKAALYTSFQTLLLLVLFLPFIYSMAYLILRAPTVKNWLIRFRRPAGGLILTLLLATITLCVSRLPVHDQRWLPTVQLQAECQWPKNEKKIAVVGNEYFRDVRVQCDTLDLRFSGRTHRQELPVRFNADWITMDGKTNVKKGDEDSLQIDWLIRTSRPWFTVTLSVHADTARIENVTSDLRFTHDKADLSFDWRADPPESLRVSARFTVHPGAKLIRKVTATYLQPPVPLNVTAADASVSYRTKVVYSDTLKLESVD